MRNPVSFFTRKKEIVLHCYTNRADVYNYFPIVKASKAIPEWFKRLPVPTYKSPTDHERNLKECVAFSSYFSKGFILPLWSDLFLDIGKQGTDAYTYQYADERSSIDFHPATNTGNHFSDFEYQHLKLMSPWVFCCDEKIEFLATGPEWYFDKIQPVNIVGGVLDFKTNSNTHVNAYVKRKEEGQHIILEAGCPIYHFIPLTEKKVRLETHLVNNETYQKLNDKNTPVTFRREFQKKNSILDQNECPFKFNVDK
tara:strand:+ start:435 stop:1196 length:762 start_codon:yes stop_codon:yes gene_type:complete